MQAGTPRFGSTGLSNIGKGAILLLDLPITVVCTGRSTHNTYRRSRPTPVSRGGEMPFTKRPPTECVRPDILEERFLRAKPMSAKWIVRIDGLQFNTLEEFFEHFAEKALDGSFWGKNLDAFNDVLRGGFGTPENGFVIEWLNHEISKERLGFDETIKQLQLRLLRCHPSNVARVTEQLMAARRREGATVFDWLQEIIQKHCPGGDEAADGIELMLR